MFLSRHLKKQDHALYLG